MTQINEAQSQVQEAAHDVWTKAGRKGTIAGATGSGKTKVALHEVEHLIVTRTQARILLVVPTIVLKETDWPKEIEKWALPIKIFDITNVSEDYSIEVTGTDAMIVAVCYKSLHQVRHKYEWDLVIFDEIHHVTQNNLGPFLQHNDFKAVIGLTATPPDPKTEPTKWHLVNNVAPIVFTYSLDQGVDDGIIADFKINVIMSPLNDKDKVIKAGSKDKPFMQTEAQAYHYLEKQLKGAWAIKPGIPDKKGKVYTKKQKDDKIEYLTFKQLRFLQNLPSKTALAFNVIRKVIDFDKNNGVVNGVTPRTIIFCGSIDQCEKLCAPYTWHSKNKKKKPTKKDPVPEDDVMDRFKKEEIPVIGVVDAANEGVNIPMLDQAVIIQTTKKQRTMVQRIGRAVRFREGYTAQVWVLCVQGTWDESWVESALEGIKKERINYLSSKQFI